MATRMPLEQTMTVIAPPHVCRDSFWTDAPRERFTELCARRQFEAPPKRAGRVRTIAEEIASASRND